MSLSFLNPVAYRFDFSYVQSFHNFVKGDSFAIEPSGVADLFAALFISLAPSL
jgi:hypothetical protein